MFTSIKLKLKQALGSTEVAAPSLQDFVKMGKLPQQTSGVTITLEELCFYQTHSQRWQPPAKSIWSQLNGQHASPRKGRGMTFSEVRQYQAGDDVRQIDWRVTARTGKVHTKLFTEERERPVVLFIDLTSSMLTGTQLLLKSVQQCHLAALLAWVALSGKDRVGAVVRVGSELVEIKPSSSKASVLRLLSQLCMLHNRFLHQSHHKEPAILADPFNALSNLCKKGSEVIVLSDFSELTDENKQAMGRLARHNRVRAIQVFDPIEIGHTLARGTQKVRGRHQELSLDFSSALVKHQLADAFNDQKDSLAKTLSDHGIALSQISSGSPLLSQLIKTL
ncbi:DUF58 domain-containing protein [Vibrio sp. SCSIO 43140]|uniref:DUF58 domain-containing protein n=1 Tax=Vibrio sp. SCSIO 43140 TaxID=2819100 RepID=UPI002074FD47|nr:DUF58 domain-containing protein [Vibrio sp. SCSIO 43140]USD62702.1 DUF58 domain-containing protein [Vibrio sp. SCSIO 43140]